jgi:hypothetical protein
VGSYGRCRGRGDLPARRGPQRVRRRLSRFRLARRGAQRADGRRAVLRRRPGRRSCLASARRRDRAWATDLLPVQGQVAPSGRSRVCRPTRPGGAISRLRAGELGLHRSRPARLVDRARRRSQLPPRPTRKQLYFIAPDGLRYTRDDGSTYAVLSIFSPGCGYGVAVNHCRGEEPGSATGVAPVRRPVTLEIGHCWIEPITFEGAQWAVAKGQQHGWGDGELPGHSPGRAPPCSSPRPRSSTSTTASTSSPSTPSGIRARNCLDSASAVDVGLSASVEADLAAGVVGQVVAGVVGEGVVSGAEHEGVAVGFAALSPGDGVVQVAHPRWPVAADGGAAALFEAGGDPLVLVVEPVLAAQGGSRSWRSVPRCPGRRQPGRCAGRRGWW